MLVGSLGESQDYVEIYSSYQGSILGCTKTDTGMGADSDTWTENDKNLKILRKGTCTHTGCVSGTGAIRVRDQEEVPMLHRFHIGAKKNQDYDL